MYATLISKINEILASVTEVQDISLIPKTKFDKFPAVVFHPDGFTNAFMTGVENMKVYRFSLDVIVGINGSTIDHVYGTVLPATVDAIVSAFDTQWDTGTISGHRSWIKIDTADAWEVFAEEDGLICVAKMYVEIKVATSV